MPSDGNVGRLRKRLEAKGCDPAYIERRCAEKRALFEERMRAKAEWQARQARVEEETYARFALDDRGYRPGSADPLKTGAARATGVAARVVGSKGTVTRWQYDEAERRRV